MYTYYNPAGVGGHQSHMNSQFESAWAAAHAAAQPSVKPPSPPTPPPTPTPTPTPSPYSYLYPPPYPPPYPYVHYPPQPVQPVLVTQATQAPQTTQTPHTQSFRQPRQQRDAVSPSHKTTPHLVSISLTANQCIALLFGVVIAALLIAIVAVCAQTHSRVTSIARAVNELARPISSGFADV
jgi:hypothetical protein